MEILDFFISFYLMEEIVRKKSGRWNSAGQRNEACCVWDASSGHGDIFLEHLLRVRERQKAA